MAAMLDAGPYCVEDAERMPIVCERLVTSARAARLGVYCSSCMTSSTRSRVASRMLGWSFSTRETVWCDTPGEARHIADAGRSPGPGVAHVRLHVCVHGHIPFVPIMAGNRLPGHERDVTSHPPRLFRG